MMEGIRYGLRKIINYRRTMKMDEEEAPKLDDVSAMAISKSHQQSSSSSTSSSAGDEIESQRSIESSGNNSIIVPVPTEAEIDGSMQAFESYMNAEGPRMLKENPEFQPVGAAFQFMGFPMVQEAVKSVLHDSNVHNAMLGNQAVQALLGSAIIGNSTLMLTNGYGNLTTINTAPNISQSSHNLVSVILNWLWENMENGLLGIFDVLKTLLYTSLESSPNPNPNPSFGSPPTDASNTKQAVSTIVLLAVINLLIVIVRRAIERKNKVHVQENFT